MNTFHSNDDDQEIVHKTTESAEVEAEMEARGIHLTDGQDDAMDDEKEVTSTADDILIDDEDEEMDEDEDSDES